jgi:hypothetical protein
MSIVLGAEQALPQTLFLHFLHCLMDEPQYSARSDLRLGDSGLTRGREA